MFQWSSLIGRHLCPKYCVPCPSTSQPDDSVQITTYFTIQSVVTITLAPLYSTERDMEMLLEEIWMWLTPLELLSYSTKSNSLQHWLTAKVFRREHLPNSSRPGGCTVRRGTEALRLLDYVCSQFNSGKQRSTVSSAAFTSTHHKLSSSKPLLLSPSLFVFITCNHLCSAVHVHYNIRQNYYHLRILWRASKRSP